MAKEFVIKHGLIVHGEITGSDIRIDDWNSVSASLSELSSNVGETVTTASISGNVITFTKSDGTTFETVVQEDTGSFFTSASVDLNTITFHYGNNESGSLSVETGTTQIRVKNTSGSPITKGTPVYITGNVGNTDMLEIAAADASDLTKMPAVGLLLADLSNNGEGYVIQGGYLKGLVTDTIDGTSTTSNDTVYVKAGGGLTMTKPTGATNYIQNIAKVARVHGSAGSLVVSSILRTNDVPNLPTGKIWVGNGNAVTSSFIHLDETNQRFGIGTDTPLKPLHIDNDSVPIRLESDTHNAVVVNYRTDEVGTGKGVQIGAIGQSGFFVQQDVVSGGDAQWNRNIYVSQSGKVYLPNLDGALQDQILYYNDETGELTPGAPPNTGSFFTSASVDLNTITFQYGASGSSGTLTIDTGSNFISNVEIDHSTTGSSLVFTGEGGAFNGAVDLSRAYQQGGGMTLNYSGSVLFNAASEWSGGNPNRKVSSTVTSMRDSGWNEWRFSDISRNFSSQYHNNAHNESVFDLITTVVNHTGQLIVRVYDDKDSAYEGFYMNSGSATIRNNANGAGDLSLYLKHIGGRGWGATSGTPGNNTINNTNVAFSFTGTQLYESGSQSQSAFTEASVTSNVVTLTRDDGTTEVLTIDTGSAVTTDISALNTFTGSIQTEVDDLKAATGSYYSSSTNSQATLRLFQADGTSITHDLFNPNNYVSSSVDLNRITFTQADGSTEVVTVETGSKATPKGITTELQFNDNGAFGATTGITYSNSPQRLDLDSTSIIVEGKSVPIQLTEGSSNSKQTVISYAQSTTSNVGFRAGNNDLGNTGRDIFVIAHGTTDFSATNTTNIFELDQAGSLIMSAYGSGNNTGNPGYYLAVDATGRIVEELITSGSGGGGTVDTGSFYVGSSVNLNTITFTKGDGLTDVITVDTGSGLTGNGAVGQIALWDAAKRLNGDSHFVWNPLNNRMGINIASPESQIHIDGYGQPIRLTSTSNTQMYIRYQNQNSTSEGMRVGNDSTSPYGGDNFTIQWDSGNPSDNSWEEIFRISGSGETFMVGLDNATTSNTLYYNSSTGEVTYGAAPSGSGGGGSGTVNTGVAGYLAYYPSNGTTVDDQTGLYWDESSGELGIGTTNPARPLHIDSANAVPIRLSSTSNNRQVIQYFGGNSNGAGVLVGAEGENDFILLQSDFLTNTVNTNLYISESGETYLPRLAADATPSDIVYYDSSTGELSYGSAPSGGGTDTNIANTDLSFSANRTLDFNGNSLTFDILQGENFNIAAESNATVGISLDNSEFQITGLASSTTANVLGIDASGNIKTMTTSSFTGGGGGSTSPGGSTTQVQFNNAGSFGGDAGLVYDSANDRLGIGGTGTPTSTLHLAKGATPLFLDGGTASQATQYIRIEPNGSPGNGVRLGVGYSSPNTDFEIDYHDGSSWDTNFRLAHDGALELPNLGADAGSTTSMLYYNTSDGRVTYGSVPSGGGGSGTPGGSTTQVQFNNAGSFGGDAGLVYDSANDRLGIGGTGTPSNTLHLAKGSTPILLDGDTATEANQYIQFLPDGLSTELGMRIGVGYSSTYKSIFTLENHNGTSWSDLINIRGGAGGGSEAGLMQFPAYDTTQKLLLSGYQTNYVTATDNSGFIYKIPFSYVKNDDSYGLGTTSPTAKLHVNGTVGSGNMSIFTSHNIVSGNHLYATNRAHIGSTATASSGQLQVTGNVSGVSIYASHDIVAYSDARSKVNIETIPDALEKVNAVRGVTYNKVDDPEGMRYMGVIAQELLEHLPEVVHQGEEGNYSVAYGNVVGVLIEAVKELTAKVEDLESRLGK